MTVNATSAPDDASPNVLAEITDFDLDRKIGAKIQMIGSALAEIGKCKKSAVLSGWRLGQYLIEKKGRLAHGEWGVWLSTLPHVSPTSATNYMRLAREIGSAADLKSSIRETLELLPALATAKPKSVAVKVVKPAPAKPKTIAVSIVEPAATATPTSVAVRIVEPPPVWPTALDSATMITGLEKELYDERDKNEALEERIAIMEEGADPKSRKAADKLNNQAELIKTLKAQCAGWQSKAAEARKEVSALKRKIKVLENPAGGGR